VIFLAVGTQYPFDRLIRYVDEWLMEQPIIEPAFAQIGEGEYTPKIMDWERFIDTDAYEDKVKTADLIIAHAGMGNIITAIENQTPIIVMNRQYKHGEHRNDHQLDGLSWMDKLEGVYTAPDKETLYQLLDTKSTLSSGSSQIPPQRQTLIKHISTLIQTG
jgi:UDP-N-acetylglucosamine transferase subunit ALG13